MELIIDERSFGITARSLRLLRNELARRIDHRIEVHQIQTNDFCCGYLLLDYSVDQAVWTGDGFRTDGGGEGGAGFRSAEALLSIYGVRVDPQFFDVPYFESCTPEEVKGKLGFYLDQCSKELAAVFLSGPGRGLPSPNYPPIRTLSELTPQYLR